MAYNNIAWSIYYQQDMSSMERADECSKKAIEVFPWVLSVRSTRGAVLVELGRVEEGLKLLNDERYSMEKSDNQARVLCSLAIAHTKKDDEVKAQQCIDDAEALDSTCEFLQRAKECIR
jgi:predicted Zn-dependent protease